MREHDVISYRWRKSEFWFKFSHENNFGGGDAYWWGYTDMSLDSQSVCSLCEDKKSARFLLPREFIQ